MHDDVIEWKYFPRYWPFVRGSMRHRWIPLTKASDAGFWCFIWSAPEQIVEQTIETPLISDTRYDVILIGSCSIYRRQEYELTKDAP